VKAAYPAQAVKEVRWLIEQSGVTATLSRPMQAGQDSFYGPHEASEAVLGSIAIEMQDLPPKDLTEIGADAVACALPDSGVRESDFLAIGDARYRVTAVKPHNFFGAVTHLDLHLTRERRNG
jgi:hypothetical protein